MNPIKKHRAEFRWHQKATGWSPSDFQKECLGMIPAVKAPTPEQWLEAARLVRFKLMELNVADLRAEFEAEDRLRHEHEQALARSRFEMAKPLEEVSPEDFELLTNPFKVQPVAPAAKPAPKFDFLASEAERKFWLG